MPAPIRFDFDANDGAHLGVFLSLAEQVAAIPAPVGIWERPGAGNTTPAGGKISAWTAGNGRQWRQDTAARQPVIAAGIAALDMTAAGAAVASMALDGPAIGVIGDFSFAILADLTGTGAETTDLHFLAGQDQGSLFRISYRYTAGNNYMRFEGPGRSLDVDLPAVPGPIALIVSVSGGLAATFSVGNVSASGAMSSAPDLQGFEIGNRKTASGAPDWPGRIHRAMMWHHALTAEERTLVLAALQA